MEFHDFPCCLCSLATRQDHLSLAAIFDHVNKMRTFQFRNILRMVFKQSLLDSSRFENEQFIRDIDSEDPPPEFSDRETNLIRSLREFMKHFYDKGDDRFDDDSSVNETKSINEMAATLTENLGKIVGNCMTEAKADPFVILSGKNSYQNVVLSCLLFASKYMARCMQREPDERGKLYIFNRLVFEVVEFFRDANLSDWIRHCVQFSDPFGIFPDDDGRKAKNVDSSSRDKEKTTDETPPKDLAPPPNSRGEKRPTTEESESRNKTAKQT